MKIRYILSVICAVCAIGASATVNYLIVNEGRTDVKAFALKDLTEIKISDSGLNFVGKEKAEIPFAEIYAINFAESAPASVESVTSEEENRRVIQTGETLQIAGIRDGESISIYSIDGRLIIFRQTYSGERLAIDRLPAGVYVLRVGNQAIKFVKK